MRRVNARTTAQAAKPRAPAPGAAPGIAPAGSAPPTNAKRAAPKRAPADAAAGFVRQTCERLIAVHKWRTRLCAPWRVVAAAPPALRAAVIAAAAVGVFAVANLAFHVARKPTELFFPVSGAFNKTPSETWRQYAALFNEYSTAAITPDLLAALAQVESAGNPVARTYWRWRLSWNPFEIYRPASSAVGMYQVTDAVLADVRRYCIRNHAVVEEGAWYDLRSCWFNRFRSRAVPSNAVELTAVSLDRKVSDILSHRRHGPGKRSNMTANLQQKQDLAVIAHLCGAGPAAAFVRGGFKLSRGERCGDHDVAAYLGRVNAMKRQFRRLAAEN